MFIQTYHLLWTTYLKSGMGQLIIPSKNKTTLFNNCTQYGQKKLKTCYNSTNNDKTNENEICLNFVNNHLHELDHQLKQYQTELNMKSK